MSLARPFVVASLLAGLVLALPACGSGRNEENDPRFPDQCIAPFTEGLSGSWTFVDVLAGDPCATSGLDGVVFLLLQDYRSLTFQGQASLWTATLCGSRASGGSFSLPVDGGIHTVNTILLEFQSETEARGNTTWSWTDGVATCQGTSTFTMTR